MSIKKLDDGRYEVDVRPQGADGKRIRRKFKTKGEAQAFERHVLVNYHNKEWIEKPADRRTLTELLGRWWIYHGKSHERGILNGAFNDNNRQICRNGSVQS